jgi:three-Cys-motif partner protein
MEKNKRQKKEIPSYLKDFSFSDDARKIINSSSIFNKKGFGLWSFKKLIFLEYYIKPYLLILSNRYRKKCYFIDFFSGCGANSIEKEKINSIGSPLVSLLKGVIHNKSKNLNNRFFKWIFVEINSDFCDALQKRIDQTCKIIKERTGETLVNGQDIEVIPGDVNISIDKLVSKLEEESKSEEIAVLAFIDPYKFSAIQWETVKKLLHLRYVDVIFTMPTGTLRRGGDTCKQKEKFLSPSLLSACSNKRFCDIPEENLGELYAKDIVNVMGRSISFFEKGASVRNSTNAEIYRIELFSHSNKAVQIAETITKKLDKINYNTLKKILDQAKGEQKTITEYK